MKYKLSQIEAIFQEAIDLEEPARAAFLDVRCAADPDLRRHIEELIDHANGAHTFMAANVERMAAAGGIPAGGGTDQFAGPYRLIRELGSGGMGTVYLAARDDGNFEQIVAVKIAGHASSPASHDRFLRERQVLANLSHPNIARLLDGGCTASGLPYLAMEYVAGEPIIDYAAKRQLSIQARLELFLGVCEAVSYAHRSLVVHRDVKPGNILVTSEGVPKLLDFGISKLLQPDTADAAPATTIGCSLFMTPEYASPEQVRGDPITTATDVYSLGAVLYELLTGRCPHQISSHQPAAILRAVCETEPPRPSSIGGRALSGDLDSLVAMAMCKDPRGRYASAGHLADDIHRYLAGKPLAARKSTLRYRASRFVRRHTWAMAAATLVLLTLLAGGAATAWQARRVVQHIKQSERRFLLFRKLANAFLFELDKKIARVESPREARNLVIATAIEYLDGLAREAGNDTLMTREVARGYEKIGDAQGIREPDALGLPAEAACTYQKAITLLEPLGRHAVPDHQVILLLARSYCNLGDVLEKSGGRQKAEESYHACRDYAGLLDDSRLPARVEATFWLARSGNFENTA